MKIIIGSNNPAKITAVKQVFVDKKYEFIGLKVPSGVSEQPFSDEETIEGAVNRATLALVNGEGKIGIGLEGGVAETKYGMFLCNWGALVTNEAPPVIAGGARILLPVEVADRLRAGEELGPVMDDFTKEQNIGKNEGAIGVFTYGVIQRAGMFSHVVKLLYGQHLYRLKHGWNEQ